MWGSIAIGTAAEIRSKHEIAEERTSVIVASLLRTAMLEMFNGMFFFFALERLIATFAWSWYEKESPSTVLVFIVMDSGSMIWSWMWAGAFIFEFASKETIMLGIACSSTVGVSVSLHDKKYVKMLTFAWSWYEKESPSTVLVFIVMDSGSMIWSWMWAGAFIFEFAGKETIMLGIACSSTVGVSVCLLVVVVNYRAHIKLKAGARINRYSVARTFQIRENIIVIKALSKLAIRMVMLNVPLFLLALCHLLMFGEERRTIIRAMFDLLIAIYPIAFITYIPFSDPVFERSIKRMPHGDYVLKLFSVLHCHCRKG